MRFRRPNRAVLALVLVLAIFGIAAMPARLSACEGMTGAGPRALAVPAMAAPQPASPDVPGQASDRTDPTDRSDPMACHASAAPASGCCCAGRAGEPAPASGNRLRGSAGCDCAVQGAPAVPVTLVSAVGIGLSDLAAIVPVSSAAFYPPTARLWGHSLFATGPPRSPLASATPSRAPPTSR